MSIPFTFIECDWCSLVNWNFILYTEKDLKPMCLTISEGKDEFDKTQSKTMDIVFLRAYYVVHENNRKMMSRKVMIVLWIQF